MPSRCRTSKDTPRKLAGRMKRRWRVVLFGLTCEIAHQIDLFVGERPHLLAVMRAHASERNDEVHPPIPSRAVAHRKFCSQMGIEEASCRYSTRDPKQH